MKSLIIAALALVLSAGALWAEGGQNQGTTGSGTTSTGSTCSGHGVTTAHGPIA